MNQLEKLPQARRYLRAARWGLNTMLEQKVLGAGYIFYVTGLLATLRAVPHILGHHDNKLSPQHEAVIDAWWTRTKNLKEHPDFLLIIRARNQNLKDGSFDSWASSWEGTSEPGVVHYEASHYIDGVRRDLEIDVRAALDWMERQLTEIEADLPPRFDEREIEQTIRDDELKNLVETGIPPQRIAGSTISARIEAGALISFRRRPQPWQDGDVLEIFHAPSGRTTLTAIEHVGFRFTWGQAGSPPSEFELEELEDCIYRVLPTDSCQQDGEPAVSRGPDDE
jgi:hypothetical protein